MPQTAGSVSQTASSLLAECAGRLVPRIDAALRDYCQPAEGCPETLRAAIEYALLAPGKRIRPILCLLAAEACDAKIEAAMPAACAVEMIHAYSLVHDDLPAMDDDELRRGRPTCHREFGEAVAILAGDALLTMGFEVLAKGVQPPAVAAACCAALAEAAGPCNLVGGQADDVAGTTTAEQAPPLTAHCPLTTDHSSAHCPLPTAHSSLESIHRRKTGALMRASLRLGGLVAGAGPEELAALDEYGQRLGLAFQITDDLLDVRSHESATGKRVGKDAARGKLTFPGLLGVDESVARAEQLIAEACQSLATFGPRAEGLDALARFVLERNR